jgi:hypothetical protein
MGFFIEQPEIIIPEGIPSIQKKYQESYCKEDFFNHHQNIDQEIYTNNRILPLTLFYAALKTLLQQINT